MHAPLEDLDRNLLALANELAVKCAAVFDRAAGATGRQAIVECSNESASRFVSPKSSRRSLTPPPMPSEQTKILFRDRLVIGSLDDGDDKVRSQLLAPPPPHVFRVVEAVLFYGLADLRAFSPFFHRVRYELPGASPLWIHNPPPHHALVPSKTHVPNTSPSFGGRRVARTQINDLVSPYFLLVRPGGVSVIDCPTWPKLSTVP